MTIMSRPYRGSVDLQKMKALLVACKQVYPYTSLHRGDLDWWIFYDTSGEPQTERIRLWVDAADEVVGWIFKTEKYCDFDITLHPDWRGTEVEAEMLRWGDAYLTEIAMRNAEASSPRQVSTFADSDNQYLIDLLQRWGYVPQEYLVYFAQSLERDIPTPVLPDGFSILPCMKPEYAAQRADVHANSFNPSRMTAAYYQGFMQAPDYDPELDTVIVAPDGRFAAFAMGWADNETTLAVFEPVGTRNVFQRKGLGQAVLYEGMQRLKMRGMTISTVGCNATIAGNLAFYRSVGYEIAGRLLKFSKTL